MKKHLCIVFLSLLLVSCAGKKPPALGVLNGNLSPCPDSPNCVVSTDGDEKHAIAPLEYSCDTKKAKELLKKTIGMMDRATLIEEKPDYLHYEFRTRVFRFVDDVEFYFTGAQLIQVRSASRVGHSDFGVNRKRVETIRGWFNETMKDSLRNPEP
jgi:uncharacterized protein (DUF1499 family)